LGMDAGASAGIVNAIETIQAYKQTQSFTTSLTLAGRWVVSESELTHTCESCGRSSFRVSRFATYHRTKKRTAIKKVVLHV
jgi:hypothetical protein